MSDILPPMSGPKVDKILGKGSIALITDETLLGLTPSCVNGVPYCIYLRQHDNRGCCNVGHEMIEKHKISLLKEMAEHGTQEALTMPMCHRSEKEAWNTAADMLQALADGARARAKAVKEPKPRFKKLKATK